MVTTQLILGKIFLTLNIIILVPFQSNVTSIWGAYVGLRQQQASGQAGHWSGGHREWGSAGQPREGGTRGRTMSTLGWPQETQLQSGKYVDDERVCFQIFLLHEPINLPGALFPSCE